MLMLMNLAETDEMIRAIQAWKSLLKPLREPKNQTTPQTEPAYVAILSLGVTGS